MTKQDNSQRSLGSVNIVILATQRSTASVQSIEVEEGVGGNGRRWGLGGSARRGRVGGVGEETLGGSGSD